MQNFRKLLFYKGNVTKDEAKKFFENLTKPLSPLLGFLDFSWLFSSTPGFHIVYEGNSIDVYVESNKKIEQISYFLFPFRVGNKVTLDKIKAKFCIPSFFFVSSSFVEFMIKTDIKVMDFKMFQFLTLKIGFGTGIKRDGCPVSFIILNPIRFFTIDMSKHPSIHLDVLEIALSSVSSKSKTEPLFEDDFGNTIGIDSFDPIQHTLIIGESGSGKTIYLMMHLKAIYKYLNKKVKMVILDPHSEIADKLPIPKKIIDFKKAYIDPFTIKGKFSPMMAQLISQLIVDSIEGNKYAERVAFHSVYLLGSIGKLSLDNLNLLLTDEAKRMEFVSKTKLEDVKVFFDNEFEDIYMKYYDKAILPLINFISEYKLHISHIRKKLNLEDLINENDVLVISFDPNTFSRRMIHFLGSAIISQMYMLALLKKFKIPTLFVIDEVARVENPVLKNIVAETRKFNLFLIMATQYLTQLRKDIVNAILSNVRNIIAFKLHKNDAALLAGAMNLKIEEYFKKVLSVNELEEKKKELFVELDSREVIVRLYDGKSYLPPKKTKTVDMNRWL